MTAARAFAVRALVRVEGGAFSHVAVPEMLRASRLHARDRAFATDLVYGTLRMQRALDHLLAAPSARPLGGLDPDVRAALRLGAYQLVRGVPAPAAVAETVAAAPGRARGYVNAVLRAVAAAGPPWPWPDGDAVAAVGVRTSHPDWIVAELVAGFGSAEAQATLAADNEPPAVTLRVNPRRSTPDAVEAELAAAGVAVTRGRLVPDALVVVGTGDLAALPALRDGRATPQDQASQAVVDLLAPAPGDRVLDVAAAPGGKATAAAERAGGSGVVVAADLHPGRAGLVARAAGRLGVRVAVLVADGRAPAVRARAFDRVLVDAPCSGLGVLRRRPEARWRTDPGAVPALAERQRDLLAAAAGAVRPGGRLVYSVCTLTAEETLGVDAGAQEALREFTALAPPGPPWRPHGRGAVVLPGDAGTDGMFVLVLERDA